MYTTVNNHILVLGTSNLKLICALGLIFHMLNDVYNVTSG